MLVFDVPVWDGLLRRGKDKGMREGWMDEGGMTKREITSAALMGV